MGECKAHSTPPHELDAQDPPGVAAEACTPSEPFAGTRHQRRLLSIQEQEHVRRHWRQRRRRRRRRSCGRSNRRRWHLGVQVARTSQKMSSTLLCGQQLGRAPATVLVAAGALHAEAIIVTPEAAPAACGTLAPSGRAQHGGFLVAKRRDHCRRAARRMRHCTT